MIKAAQSAIYNIRVTISLWTAPIMLWLRLSRTPPEIPVIVVYQMGKVASETVYYSLQRCAPDRIVLHFHTLDAVAVLRESSNHLVRLQLRKFVLSSAKLLTIMVITNQLIRRNRKIMAITLFRDPFARNMSEFFQSMGAEEATETPIGKLIDRFIAEFDHLYPTTWFDRELKRFFGIDVYADPFPKEHGYRVISEGKYDLLLMSVEVPDDRKQRLLSEFCRIQDFVLVNTNIGETKYYKESYSDFKAKIKLPGRLSRQILDSRYVSHFFTADQVSAWSRKWLSDGS